MLGGIGLFKVQCFDQLAGGQFAIAEGFDDGDARGVSERLEDFGFKPAERICHIFSIF